MKKRYALISFLIMSMLLVSCAQAPAPSTQSPAKPEQAATEPVSAEAPAETVLTVTGPTGEMTYTLADMKAMQSVSGQAGLKSSTGKIFPPAEYTGVLITDLLKAVGGDDPSMAVEVEAKDGYSMTYSYEQIAKGAYITYDPATGDEETITDPLQTILAYASEGKDLDPEQDGYLRLMVISPKNDQVVDGHWTTKFVVKLTVKPLVEEWKLNMEGAIKYSVDRGSYESCATTKCHQATWQDDHSQVWTGVPLYLLLGEVDDEIKHDDNAYNKDLAAAGYMIDIIAADGYTVTLDSKKVDGNKEILVAYTMNDNPLTDKDFPLKLVGAGLEKKEMVGGIAKIILHIDPIQTDTAPEATEAPTAEPTVEAPAADEPAANATSAATLEFSGMVTTPLTWTMDDLKGMEVVKVTVDGPKEGKKTNAEGVRLSVLLALVNPKDTAKTLVLKASDGYLAEVTLEKVQACADCMVAFDKDGTLKAVMPGFDSGNWVKQLASLSLK
jgi:DMSO/TMAO reductase YedYZ molybdopterin-dependent catalytic subunit